MKKTGKDVPEWTVFIKCKLNEDPKRVQAVLVTLDELESREEEERWQLQGFTAWREVQWREM